MRLNQLKPSPGAKQTKKRLGRGIGSGWGKTSGKGHKGQTARSGGYHKTGFEGGQTPLQRRLPKFGFTSLVARTTDEVRVSDLNKIKGDHVDLEALKSADLVRRAVKRVKIIASGKLTKPLKIRGLAVTKGARAVIEAAGGKIEE